MTVYTNRIRRSYERRRSAREMIVATLLLVAAIALLAVAACEQEQEEQQVSTYALTKEQKREIVRSWYGEVYPQYVARR